MVVGEILMQLASGPYYSPQFNRGGNAAVFSCEVLQLAGGIGLILNLEVQHKNSNDTTWTSLNLFGMNSVGPQSFALSGIKEQLRYKFTVLNGSAPTDAVCFNMLAPQWRPY